MGFGRYDARFRYPFDFSSRSILKAAGSPPKWRAHHKQNRNQDSAIV